MDDTAVGSATADDVTVADGTSADGISAGGTSAGGTVRDRAPLTRERVLQTALALADRIGIEQFTIRRLAAELGVKPMTLYHHVPNKEAILDGVVDLVFAEIALPPSDLEWTAAVRHRCLSAREVFHRHPWAPPFMESRTNPGPATLHHHEAVLGCLRGAGLPSYLVAHAYAIIDSFVYGFAMQEAALPFNGREEIADLADALIAALPEKEYPNLTAFTREHVLVPGYDFGDSYEFGLDLLLDGLAAAAAREA